MAKRSLKSSVTGRSRAKQAIERRGWTQEYLATEAGLSTRNSVWKFLTGRPVDRNIFMELCFQLDLNWEEIADLPQDVPEKTTSIAVEDPFCPDYLALKTKLRYQFYKKYSTIRSSFDLTQQFDLKNFYTDLKLLPHLSHQQWLDVDDLQTSWENGDLPAEDDPFSLQEILEDHHKLVLLGKPGCGKTTLLKHLTLQCYDSQIQAEVIPLYIPLREIERYQKDLDDWSLEAYLQQLLAIADPELTSPVPLLTAGRLWLLLDSLDEISRKYNEDFLQKIQKFSQDFPQVSIIITSRIAAQNYFFSGFTYLEIANFSQAQIETYIRRWFSQANTKAEELITNLNQPDNRDILELAKTPLLLELICCAFQERAKLPSKRTKLYREGIRVLLNRGARSQAFQTDYGYNALSQPEKLTLLSRIASETFARGHFYFEKEEVLLIIRNYLFSTPDSCLDSETFWLRSEAILRAIQVQHGFLVEQAKGVYSFSHVTFQEYLTARQWSNNNQLAIFDPSQDTLDSLAEHFSDPHWQTVIGLTLSMVPSADHLLQQLHNTIGKLITSDPTLVATIKYLEVKSNSLTTNHNPSAVKAFYLGMLYGYGFNLATQLDKDLGLHPEPAIALDVQLNRVLGISASLVRDPDFEQYLNLFFALDLEQRFPLAPAMAESLQFCKDQLPSPLGDKDIVLLWWREQGSAWHKSLEEFIYQCRYPGFPPTLTNVQEERLKKYYYALIFLLSCSREKYHISPAARASLENNIFSIILNNITTNESNEATDIPADL